MDRCFNFHLLILVLFVSSEISSSDGVSPGQMISAVGDSVTFPTRVPDTGTLIFNGHTVAHVSRRKSETDFSDDFTNRLHWANQTGLFTVSRLGVNDSGLYTVESLRAPKVKQDYQMEVYEKVSDPHVKSTTYNSSEFCSVLCTTRYVKGLRLAWYKDDLLIRFTNSSIGSNVTIELQLEQRNLTSHPYGCVASNPVSNKSTTIHTVLSCPMNTEDEEPRKNMVSIIACSVGFVLVIILMFVCLMKKKLQQTEDLSATEELSGEVQYSVVNHSRPTQTTDIREPACEEVIPLTTVYDRIRPERLSDCSGSGTN